MIKRTLFFSNAVCLTLKYKQLVIFNKDTQEETSVPIEDIGFVVIENNLVYVSIPVINELAANNAAVIFCNDKHLPFTMNLPLDCNTIQNQVFSVQIGASLPTKKKCWKQIIEHKITNQAKVLEKFNFNAIQIYECARNVKSGDSTNRESVAARIYWDSLIFPSGLFYTKIRNQTTTVSVGTTKEYALFYTKIRNQTTTNIITMMNHC